MKRIKSDKIVLSDSIFDGYVYVDGKTIVEVSKRELPFDEEFDVTGCYVSAGFIDIHTHGGGGNRFEGSIDEIVEGCNFHLKHGTTSICPTVSAAPFAAARQNAFIPKKARAIFLERRRSTRSRNTATTGSAIW